MTIKPFFPLDVLTYVAAQAKLKLSDLQGRKKTSTLVRARAVAAKVLSDRGFSYAHIGRLMKKHHTTIMYAVDTFSERYSKDTEARVIFLLTLNNFCDANMTFDMIPVKEFGDAGWKKVNGKLDKLAVGDTITFNAVSKLAIKRFFQRVNIYNTRNRKKISGRTDHEKNEIIFTRIS